MSEYDGIIIGLGICGNALAYSLSKKGKRILAFERDLSEPDKIIGELLQPGGVSSLTRLGMEQCLDGIDSPPILGYAVYPSDGSPVALPYPKTNGIRPRGRSFHHGRFIQNLRSKAREVVHTIIEATVTSLVCEGDRVVGVNWKKRNGEKGTSRADMTFVCDGLFSGLRENFTDDQIDSVSKFVGLVLPHGSAAQLPFAHHGHVFLIDPSPTLIYPISSTEVRVLVDVPEPVPKTKEDMRDYLLRVTAPQLPEPVRSLFIEAVRVEQRFRSMPCGILHSAPIYRPGAMLLGDAMNVRHPLTGGGMTVAFNDVCLISEGLANVPSFLDDNAVRAHLKNFFSERKQLAAQINILAQALYAVFRNPNLRKACVEYFMMGGEAVNGPMALLGGIFPSPSYLTAHFFAVALSGTARRLAFPTPTNIWNAGDTIYSATKLILPLMHGEHLFEPTYPTRLRSKL